jgi:hypothetical protein
MPEGRLDHTRRMIVFTIAAALLAGSATAKSFEVPLWPGPGVENDRRVKSIVEDEPCGRVALARVSRLPEPDDKGPLHSERVVELSNNGHALVTWPKPANYLVFGVSRDRLLVGPSADSTHGLLVTTHGDLIETGLSPNRTPQAQFFACPTIAAFHKSVYVGCWKFVDTESHVTRLLAYEGPCT